MAAFLAELLFDFVGSLIGNWLRQVFVAVCGWLDTGIHGRAARLVVGGLLGVAAYFLIPIVIGLLGF
ncbi:hypothetical protein JQ625_10955 [Bradyrhizobium diazoefficiens]|nr:hypothetical protein [Bradyrhizobium diazoefficiens]MBR0775350.1 hypothetical protein [Bradyrhizobium diazoefficiens]